MPYILYDLLFLNHRLIAILTANSGAVFNNTPKVGISAHFSKNKILLFLDIPISQQQHAYHQQHYKITSECPASLVFLKSFFPSPFNSYSNGCIRSRQLLTLSFSFQIHYSLFIPI